MFELTDLFDVYLFIVLIFRVYCYISITILPFVLYNSFFESRYKPNSNFYHKKEWYYLLKVIWAKSAVNRFKKSFADAIKNESDVSLERPRKLTTFMRSDTQTIYGTDPLGNSIYLRITLREKRLAECCLQLRLTDGRVFQLPEHPQILLCSIPDRKWRAGGLEIIAIEPFSNLRITYNGFLRNVIRNCENEDIGEVQHCQFNFIWSAATEAKFFPQDVSTNELAEAVAVEPWKDAKWIKLLGYHTGFDQYGSLHGVFTFSTPTGNTSFTPGTSFTPTGILDPVYKYSTVELRMSACRKRAWGPGEARVLHRMLTIYGADQQGFTFSIGVRSYSKGCKELLIGSAMLPNKKVLFIEDCDISLPDFFEDGVIPGAFTFSFKVAGKYFKCTAFSHKTSVADMNNNESIGYNGKLVKTKYIINGEEAFGYGVFWYKNQGPGQEHPPYIIRSGIQTLEPEREFVASLTSVECRSVYLAGIKGTSLSLLTAIHSDQFKTLDGFCVLASALEKHLDKNPELKQEVKKVNDIACGVIDGNLQQTCDRVRDLFTSTPLQQHFLDLVVRELTLLKFSLAPVSTEHAVRCCWAVRGSSIHEHLHEKPIKLKDQTFLDCFTDEDVVKAITRCWGSVYEYDKVLFRRKRGLPILCNMAVIVQHTLDADAAGMLTTIHPETGNPAVITITANYGLGLVTSTSTVDTVIIHRTWRGNLSVATTTPGTKSHRVIIGTAGITQVENNSNSGMCVSREQLLQIARAGLVIEQALGGPVRVEWGVYKDQIYIISCRPLRQSSSSWCSPDSRDTPRISPKDCFIFQTSDNLLGSSEPCCALSSSTCVRYLDQALQRVYEGVEIRRGGYRKLVMLEGVVGCDVYQTVLRQVDKEITEELKIHELVTTGRYFVSKDLNQEAVFRNRVTKWTENIVSLCRMLNNCWNSKDNTEEAQVLSQAIRMTSHPDTTSADYFKVINRNLHLLKHIIYLHTTINHTYTFYQKLILNLIKDNHAEMSSRSLQSFLNHYSTSTVYETSSRVQLLAAVLHSRDLGVEFNELAPTAAVAWLEENAPDLVELLARVMEEIGCRGVNEFDFASEVWESNTFALVRIIQLLINQMENKTYVSTTRSLGLQHKMNGKIVRWLNNRLHNAFSRKCRTQKAVARAINKFRGAYVDLGHRLVEEGKLPSPRLVFHLTHQEIKAVVLEKRPDLIDIAMQRAIFHKQSNPKIPNIYTGTVATAPGTTFEPEVHQRVIGSTVVGGNVTGRVCVLENIGQVELLRPDDILVTKSLDLGWSPYFALISGLICDTGTLISQGAIAVYKWNLPCIIAEDATNIFRTGDQVVMIGNSGVVEKILNTDA